LPGRPMLQHGVKYGQKLMHTCRQADIEQVLREKKPFILRCMLDGIKKRQGGLSNGPDSR
jgi:hypothetical protein